MILILTQCFPSRLGGIESLISNLAINLGLEEKVIVFADTHNSKEDFNFDNKYKNIISVKRISGIKLFRRRKKIKSMKLLIESQKVDLVICESWKSIELASDYLIKKQIPTICLAHGNDILSVNTNKIKRIKNSLNKSNLIVANSIYTKNLVENLINRNNNIDIIHPGAVDIRNIQSEKIKNISGKPLLLTLSRLEKRKGHVNIIYAIKKLVADFPDIQYVIAGTGIELYNLKELVFKLKLDKNILFVGNVNENQKKYLFSKTDLMIMPTIDETRNQSVEGFGISYIEAAFFGIPSIASNIGGTPEAVIHNVTGKIINNIEELYFVIRELLMNKNLNNDLGAQAQQRAINEFTWDIITKKYISLIHKLVNKIN